MLALLLVALVGAVVLIVSTDQFVSGASTVATNLHVSSVLVGAVILGCGTGLPELALALFGSHRSPWKQILGLEGHEGTNIALLAFVVVLVVILSIPALAPHLMARHSPVIMFATLTFAILLRGALDRYEGTAMLAGFMIGIAWIVHNDRRVNDDPFAPLIDDDYETHGAYIEAPVMTPVQVGMTRAMAGMLGTAIGAQTLALAVMRMLDHAHVSDALSNLAFVSVGSVLPHIVVALQALKQHHKGLAIGNLIGSNLFHSLAIGGLISIVRPYEVGGHVGVALLGVVAATAVLTWMLLHTDDELSQRQGVALLGSYVGLVLLTVS